MLKIRLKLIGRKKLPTYRIVIIDSRKPRDSKYLEDLGWYSPILKKGYINKILLLHYIKLGAQPTKRTLSIIKTLIKI